MESNREPYPVLEEKDNLQDSVGEIHSFLEKVVNRDRLFKDPHLDALYQDAAGLLVAISNGAVTVGQPRIVDRLIQIVEDYPEGKDASALLSAIASCSKLGVFC